MWQKALYAAAGNATAREIKKSGDENIFRPFGTIGGTATETASTGRDVKGRETEREDGRRGLRLLNRAKGAKREQKRVLRNH